MYVNMKIPQLELKKMRQKYIRINTDEHNLWKFTSLKIQIHNIHRNQHVPTTNVATHMFQQPI